MSKWNHSEEAKVKMRESKIGEKNPMWKGDEVGLSSLHEWITHRLPKPKLCQGCRQVPPIDLANISQKYLRDLSDWEWLCRICHMAKDGRMKRLLEFNYSRDTRHQVVCLGCSKEFLQHRARVRYCNHSCYLKNAAGRHKR